MANEREDTRRTDEAPEAVPEADALEQAEPVEPEDDRDVSPSDASDAPEADALEQSRVVPHDDER
jgi:hypothetical protein